MLRWALAFVVLAVIAAVFGFTGIAADSAWIAKLLFFAFLAFALVSFLFGRGRTAI